jgi:transposase
MLNATDLPDDIAALKAMLLASEARAARIEEHAGRSEARLAHLTAELSKRDAETEHLKLVLAKLRRMQFGRSSEKLDQQIEQLELQLEDLEAEEAVERLSPRHWPRWRSTSQEGRTQAAVAAPAT